MTVLGTATGAAVALGSSLATGGIAFAAYGAVAKSVITQSATAATAVQAAQNKYNAAIAAGAKQSTAYLAEQKAINLAYAQMSPAQIALSKQLGDLQNDWQGVEKSVTPVIAMSVAPWLSAITSAAKFAKPVVTDVSGAISSLGSTFDALVNLPAFGTFTRFIGAEGTDVIASGGGALMNFFHGFILLLPQVKPLIDDVDTAVSHLGSSFLTWSQSDGPRRDITAFLAWLHDNGPVVGHLLLSIGGALKNLGGGLLAGPAGADEIRLLTGFFGMIAKLPPSFVQPVSDLAASLLIISKFGIGRKVITLGVNLVGTGIAKLWNLLTPGGSIDFTGKFSGAAAMQAAADTMVTAAGAMQKAADTMAGAGAEGEGVAGAEGGAGAEGAAGAAGAEGAAGGTAAKAAEGAGTKVLGGISAFLPVVNFAAAGAFAIYALSGAFDDVTGKAGKFVTAQAQADKATGTNIAGYRKLAATLKGILPSGPGGLTGSESAGLMKALDLGDLRGAGSQIAALAEAEKKASSMAAALAQEAFAKATKTLTTAIAAGHNVRDQFASDLTDSAVNSGKARTLTDEYTLAVQHNGTTSQAAQQIRAQMIADFEHQGLSAQQADKLVGTYTDGVAANGNTIAAKAKVRAQLIQDFENAGLTAKAAAAKVGTLIGQIGNIKSKSVDLSVKASGSFTITGQSVSAGPGTHIQGGVATGGLITGPGTGTSDTAGLYALSNKEYVHNAAAVAHYGTAFMDAVNQQRIPKMASGGLAGTFSGSPSGLGAFDAREWRATQSMIESADASAAGAALRKSIAKARAQIMGGLGDASGTPLQMLEYARSFLGTPYVWGGTTPGGWDCCLTGDTLVTTADGTKPIVDIRAGDRVVTWADGEPEVRRVIRRSEPRYQMTYEVATASRSVKASGNHPFLVTGDGCNAWTEVDDLQPGDLLVRLENGRFETEPLVSVTPLRTTATYDITVQGTHNFIAGGLVTHNSGYTDWVYHHFGIPAPRTSQQQQLWAQPSGDQPAALVFFYGTGGTATHVGLSIGNGTMMNAADPALGTLISSTAGNSGFGVPPNAPTGQRGAGPGPNPRIFDYAGWLPPGLTLVDNRTGSPELLHRGRGGGSQQGPGMDVVAGLLSRLIGAVYDNAGMTADGVASAIGAAAGRESVRSAYSPRW
ncbi:MAG TPA: NlpC/P60 family protein [Trebonia sp.]